MTGLGFGSSLPKGYLFNRFVEIRIRGGHWRHAAAEIMILIISVLYAILLMKIFPCIGVLIGTDYLFSFLSLHSNQSSICFINEADCF